MNWNMADMVGKPMTDIVERLRSSEHPGCREAADEIERLRGDLQASEEFAEEYRQVRDQNADEIERLRKALEKIASSPTVPTWEKNIARTALQKDEGE